MRREVKVSTRALVVYVTVPNPDEAKRIAHVLIGERLAACVNIVCGIQSVYRWEGKIASDEELLLIIKTTRDQYSSLEKRVKDLHSYSTPEVIALPIEEGSAEYLRWLHESTSLESTSLEGTSLPSDPAVG